MQVGLPVGHLKLPSRQFQAAEIYNHSENQRINLQMLKTQTACRIRLITTIIAVCYVVTDMVDDAADRIADRAADAKSLFGVNLV